MIKKITNTLNKPLVLFYRIPIDNTNQSKLIEINLPPRAILHEVNFTDENFSLFEKQNMQLIESKTIIIGKATDKEAEKVSIDNAIKEKKIIKQKKDKIIKSFENTATSTNTKMSISINEG